MHMYIVTPSIGPSYTVTHPVALHAVLEAYTLAGITYTVRHIDTAREAL